MAHRSKVYGGHTSKTPMVTVVQPVVNGDIVELNMGSNIVAGDLLFSFEHSQVVVAANADNNVIVTIELPDATNVIHGTVVPAAVQLFRSVAATTNGITRFTFKDFNGGDQLIVPKGFLMDSEKLQKISWFSCNLIAGDDGRWIVHCPILISKP